MDFDIPKDDEAATASKKAALAARLGAFRGRTGHGGGPCTQRNLDPNQLQAIVEAACLVAIGIERAEQKAETVFIIETLRREADRVEKDRRRWGITIGDRGIRLARAIAKKLERRTA